MLTELKHVRQTGGEGRRRWFADDYFDLIVWLDDSGAIMGFQLCYDKRGTERALTWKHSSGFTHERIDTGEDDFALSKQSPILVKDGIFDYSTIAEQFRAAAGNIDHEIAGLVHDTLMLFPE